MTTAMNRALMLGAAETYGIPLPDYVVEAQAMLDAAEAYTGDVLALQEPSLSDVTSKTIGKTIDAVLAFRDRDDRLKLAQRVEANAASGVDFAYMRFREVLMVELAAPFDSAAATFMNAHDMHNRRDPKAVRTLADLIRVRDLLAGQVGDGLPAINLDIPTRTATFACRHDIVNRYRLRTSGLERGTEAWLDALLSICGCRLKWQTPAMQREHINTIPAELDQMSTVGSSRGGDAA